MHTGPTQRQSQSRIASVMVRISHGLAGSLYLLALVLTVFLQLSGLLYITDTPDDSSANLTSVTWDVPFVSDENWIVNASFPNGTALGSLYIRPDQDNAIGVLPMAQASDVNGNIIGFARFAWQLVYNNNTLLESKFWAEPTDIDGIYALVWNSGGDTLDGSYDVVVEVIADS